MNTTAQTMSIGQVISYTTGRIEIALQRTEHTYTVTTTQGGTLRIDDNSGAYATEAEARAVARIYAEQYRDEYVAELTRELHTAQRRRDHARAVVLNDELDRLDTPAQAEADRRILADIAETIRTAALADTVPTGTHRQVAPTMAGAQHAKVSDPQALILAAAASNGGIIARSAQANVRQLMALDRKGLATLNYQSGRGKRRVVESATLTKRGYAAAVNVEVS